MRTSRIHPARAFTLVELLVTFCIVTVLACVVFHLSSMLKEKTRRVACMGQMRQIGSAIVARGMENNDRMYTTDEIGKSSYRAWKDPLSLCQVLEDFLPGQPVWVSPGAPKRALKYQNSYAWSRSTNVTEKRMSELSPGSVLLWNNHTFILPSVHNVPEAKGGPKNVSAQLYYYPWKRHSANNWLYLDLHVETW